MNRYTCVGFVPTTLRTFAESPELAAELFRQEHGVLPATVDGSPVIGDCEHCGLIVFAGAELLPAGGKRLCWACVNLHDRERKASWAEPTS